MRFVIEAELERVPFATLCRGFGVSRRIGYKWLERYRQLGVEGLRDQSHAPRSHPNLVEEATAERIIALRQEHPTWGPRKLRAWLSEREPRWQLPAASTVGELLKRRGLVVRRERQRRPDRTPHTTPLAHAAASNDVWCIDYKGDFSVGDGTRCYPLTVTDAYSRYLLRCQGERAVGGNETWRALESAFREYGLPSRIRSDNGPPFASNSVCGLTTLSVWWIRLGILPERIKPGRPDQNGRHERMHRTLGEETLCPPQPNLRRQQRAFDDFRRVYNEERPHEALGQKPPSRFYTTSPRPFPRRLPEIDYAPHIDVRRVHSKGYVRWRNSADLYLSEALIGEHVGFEPIDFGIWRVVFGPLVLAYWSEPLAHLGLIKPHRWTGPKCPPTAVGPHGSHGATLLGGPGHTD